MLKNYRLFIRLFVGGNGAGPSGSQLNLTDGNLTVSSSQTEATISDLVPATKYRLWAVAINNNGKELISSLGRPVDFTTNPEGHDCMVICLFAACQSVWFHYLAESTPPTDISVSNITAVSVTVSWNKPKKVLGLVSQYRLIFRWNSGKRTKLWTRNEFRLEKTVRSLLPYTNYSVEVTAGTNKKTNGFIWSDASEVVNFKTKQAGPC